MNLFSRRLATVATALMLVALLGAAPAVARVARDDSFNGSFDLEVEWTGQVLGRISAEFSRPSVRQLVPGTYDFYGAAGNPLRETHAQIAHVDFWFDPGNPAPGMGGSNVAFASGVQCTYLGPGDTYCQPFAVMFIDVLDPTHPNQVALAEWDEDAGDWNFSQWFHAGNGAFQLRLATAP